MHKTTLILFIYENVSENVPMCHASGFKVGIEIVANERVCQASSFRVRRHETTLTVA